MRMIHAFIVGFLSFAILGCESDNGHSTPNPDSLTNPQWTVNLGRSTEIPFFPDENSNYFTYAFERDVNDETIIRLDGTFPNARYMSVIVYNNNLRDPVSIVRDVELSPSSGSVNPFQDRAYSDNQQYQIHLVPSGVSGAGLANPISYDSGITNLSVFIRYYLPQGDDLGGVPLPVISAINTSGNPVQAPDAQPLEDLVNFDDIVNDLQALRFLMFDQEPPSSRDFFRINGNASGNFANPDNEYLLNATTLETDQVVLLRWRAPQAAENFTDFSQDDMRYYSMSLSNTASQNLITLADTELYIAADGYINLVIARADIEVQTQADGLNFMTWPSTLEEQAYILYRNMLINSSFSFGINQCQQLSGNFIEFQNDPQPFIATNFMEAYAPTGKRMSKAQFLDDFGGINVSY